ncbi:hypothetical protein [Veillonella magna]|uniref:Peptidase C39-like domain-containing protein n=1 Tax=Veillonella magna TaxID=464322 RepID=A0ABS2GK11_9FIRM|nr:hypothetical protein [Veillonella magna]MBM6825350.1 hypothetical protein [Veillonella magna]MBM6913645.1 hypothetical protein [Veillonella magna]
MEVFSIKHPEWLQVKKDGRFSYGYNQEWYRDDWQQLAGCGPTTATQLISYAEFRDHYLDSTNSKDGEEALRRMETIWNYVRPRFGGGLYKTHWLSDGLTAYIEEHKLPYKVPMLSVYPFASCKPSLEAVVDFIEQGLQADSPIAFLNRHRGRERELSTWHWVPIVKLMKNNDDIRCMVYDEEIERIFSLKRWLKDTMLGGGFAYVQHIG